MSAKYTITIQEMIEDLDINIFNFDYNVNFGVEKELLEDMFINKFYLREICFETVSMWQHVFKYEWKTKLMKYNKIFDLEKQLLLVDPLVEYTEKEIANTVRDFSLGETTYSQGTSTMDGDEKLTTKDTPLSEYDTSEFVSGLSTNKLEQNATSEVEGERTNDEDETIDVDRNVERKGGYEKIVKYIDILRNYVEEFINSFNDMFMGIY